MADDDELQNLNDRVKNQSGARALASPVYFLIQQLSVLISINLVFPLAINVRWHGSLADQAFFIFVYAIIYSVTGLIFLAVAAWFSIMLECIKYFGEIRKGTFDTQTAPRDIALKVISGSQPRWLISLAPPVVPMLALGVMINFFRNNLLIDSSDILLQACILQGLLSYVVTLPWVLKAQSALDEAVNKIDSNKN
ncbi:MAG: hypothetical protein K8F91_08935 [Candidatus Obscuribacterales bacterium]|nr:hypothetical protein [Candidatus Obscuribacterales bacterium]